MTDYLQKFRLDGKTAFVIGGLGFIGSEVSIALAMAGAKTIVIDLDNKKSHLFHKEKYERGFDITVKSFNCADMEKLEKNFSKRERIPLDPSLSQRIK